MYHHGELGTRGLALTASLTALPHPLAIVALVRSESLSQALRTSLCDRPLVVSCFDDEPQWLSFVEHHCQEIDCLFFEVTPSLGKTVALLRARGILLPAALCFRLAPVEERHWIYHRGEVSFPATEIAACDFYLEQAIANFLKVDHVEELAVSNEVATSGVLPLNHEPDFVAQQTRLTEKLRARLGYLGVYYKRDAKHFLRHLPQKEQQEFIADLKRDYGEIVLIYFSNNESLNAKIDNFVDKAFFADISVAQIVEAHMELMDEFAKQLKLEGRSEEILLDYRLTLIDIIAHLCEMYRRSIPRVD